MLVIQYGEKKKNIYQSWSEVPLKKAIGAIPIEAVIPKVLREILYSDKTGGRDKESLDFYKKWVAYWLEEPVEEIGKMSAFDQGDQLGVLTLFNMFFVKFLYTPSPETFKPSDRFEYKGVTYCLPSLRVDSFSKQQQMASASFDEYVDAVLLLAKFSSPQVNDFTSLGLLTAVLFRPVKENKQEEYDSNKVQERATLFQDLTMDKVWTVYFFLFQYSQQLQSNTEVQFLLQKANEAQVLRQQLPGLIQKQRSPETESLTNKV